MAYLLSSIAAVYVKAHPLSNDTSRFREFSKCRNDKLLVRHDHRANEITEPEEKSGVLKVMGQAGKKAISRASTPLAIRVGELDNCHLFKG